MAERILRQLIDDISGSDIPDGAGERVTFSLRGVDYQIDLSEANVAKLDKALKPYADAATKVGGRRGRRGAKSASVSGSTSKEQLAEIRAWARKKGYEVSDRGRIKAEIVEAFEAAQ
ncbi:histone-like nucleoid-structuring protein Lsr2 [Mycobacterium sp. PDNC021]|uniref:histone-like nucleoid-structuring protein Lsr2 n=1 Tax=Mycobacterium sp. PDNC021 TaxID=3391399 RepID=UPI003AAABE1C